MKLDMLEILGFKSFADRTVLRFNPGMTAIVGPNGCGKTNITDAIRWVLGEQRPTALRGSSMQEVIFNGSRDRKPLGMAEVTLTFANALGLIPVEYSEVSVTRRVFRDGESHYLLNRATCNLKDIRDLFMGTGVGAAAYSVIEQKMVDAILSDRAEERRLLFEEAAGVTKYKSRRKAAERKLVATEEDLRRLSDILSEVRKNTNALRRQMGKARRFEALQKEELRLALALARVELDDLDAREAPLRQAIAALEAELARGATDADEREAALSRLDAALAERRAGEHAHRERLEAAAAELEGLERGRMLADEGRRHATFEVERLEREIAEHRAQARSLWEKREGLEAELATAREEAVRARREAEARGAAVDALMGGFEAAQSVLREAREARDRRTDDRLRVQAEVARAQAERQAAADRRSELEAALGALHRAGILGPAGGPVGGQAAGPAGTGSAGAGDADLDADDSRAGTPDTAWLLALAAAEAPLFAPPDRDAGACGTAPGEEGLLARRVEDLGAVMAACEAELSRAREDRLTEEGGLAALEAELAELEARRREVTARLDTLEELQDGFAGFGEGARQALEARDAIAPGLRGPLGVEVEVADPRYTTAVDAYLDAFLDALLTAESGEALAVLEFWRERNQTGAVWPLADVAPAHAPVIDAAAGELVLRRGTEAAGLRGELDRYRDALFGRLLLAEDLNRAVELRRRLNQNGGAGWYVVAALSGEILEPSGMVRLPHRKGEVGGVSRFHQAEHLRAVLAEIADETLALEARVEGSRRGLAAAGELERGAEALLAERSEELDRAGRDLERLRDARRAALGRASELARELAAVTERHARESRLADEARVLVESVHTRLEAAEAEWREREAEVEQARVEREAALRELGAAELAGEQRAAALGALEREARYLEESRGEQEQQAAAEEAELCLQRRRITSLEAEGLRLVAAAGASRGRLEELRLEHATLEQAIRALDQERASREAEARAARKAHQEGSQRLHAEEMRLADLLHRRQSIHTILETEFGQPLPELVRVVERAAAPGADLGAEEVDVDGAPPRGPRTPDEQEGATPGGREGAVPAAEDMPEERAARIERLREELGRVRDRKAALGPVNLLALEEFATEKERLDFLEAQYGDLVKAREDLRLAIRKINATARELFVETFARARENFRATFGTLFDGGVADISLADETDPLESAIEIEASPRGKRIQAVNLLSGGERALTALSLLFAIYLVKPSPFCILDEVDAPLDDANIGRFLRMIRSFSDRTQFIVVTHNKRTMEASDYLYGVTMEEPGISTLVSVDFERRHRFDYDAIAYRGNGGALREPTGGESPPAEGPEAWGEAESRQAHVGD